MKKSALWFISFIISAQIVSAASGTIGYNVNAMNNVRNGLTTFWGGLDVGDFEFYTNPPSSSIQTLAHVNTGSGDARPDSGFVKNLPAGSGAVSWPVMYTQKFQHNGGDVTVGVSFYGNSQAAPGTSLVFYDSSYNLVNGTYTFVTTSNALVAGASYRDLDVTYSNLPAGVYFLLAVNQNVDFNFGIPPVGHQFIEIDTDFSSGPAPEPPVIDLDL